MSENLALMSVGSMTALRTNGPLLFRPKKVLLLIKKCIEKNIALDIYVLQDWYMEEIIKPRNRMRDGNYLYFDKEKDRNIYERLLEYDYFKRTILENNGLLPYYYLNEAKQIVKYHIGSLVLKGFLTVFPTIQLDSIPEIEQPKL